MNMEEIVALSVKHNVSDLTCAAPGPHDGAFAAEWKLRR